MNIVDALGDIRRRIEGAAKRTGRSPSSVQLVAVSKSVPPEKLKQAADAGQTLFGENYVQEAQRKFSALPGSISLHFIGALQRNKAAQAVEIFDLIHSVDRLPLAAAIAKAAEKIGKRQRVLLQVNLSGEETKSGVAPEGAEELCREITKLPSLKLEGLMLIGTWHPPEAEDRIRRREFIALRDLRDNLEKSCGLSLPELSMGMSDDFEVAIEEGATMVRVGSAIFGER